MYLYTTAMIIMILIDRCSTNPNHQPIMLAESFPLINVDTQPERTAAPRSDAPRRFQGHHFWLRFCFALVALVLSINVLGTAIVAIEQKAIDGIATFRVGDCTLTERLDFSIHLLINILSTSLVGASNYCMQCVSAPTRKDIDKAHKHHTWMDIGVLSVRNLKWISRRRKVLWCLLCISSVPLHLTYNSVIFSGISVADYNMFVVTPTFFNVWEPSNVTVNDETVNSDAVRDLAQMHDSISSLEGMDTRDCYNTFTHPPISTWSDVLVVTTFPDANNSFLDWAGGQDGFGSDTLPFKCDQATIDQCDKIDDTTIGDRCVWIGMNATDQNGICYPVDYCLARKAQQLCSLNVSVPILVTVLVFNAVKLLCMAVLVWWVDSEPLVTLGDAVASFLDCPGMSPVSFVHSSALHVLPLARIQ